MLSTDINYLIVSCRMVLGGWYLWVVGVFCWRGSSQLRFLFIATKIESSRWLITKLLLIIYDWSYIIVLYKALETGNQMFLGHIYPI